MTPPVPPSRFAWRTLFARTRSAVFVFGSNRRFRYANPAWEKLTGESLANYRGTKVTATRRSLSVFAPPPEVWTGREARVRRAAAGTTFGPPWWDITFVPLVGEGEKSVLGVVGYLSVVGQAQHLPRVKVPEAVGALRAEYGRRFAFRLLDGPAVVSQRLASQARAAAICEVPVWLVGEPGTGKETLARIIHQNSPRKERAFVGLNCAAFQPYLIEGMLFGKGGLATGASVGTLYLKRPAELIRPLQNRILAWCESAFGPRLISADGSSAAEFVLAGNLAPAFQTRYSALEIVLPALRDYLGDLPHLLDRLGSSATPEALLAMQAYHWPGNLRELVEIAAQPMTRERLPRAIWERALIAASKHGPAKPPPKLDEVLELAERRMIQAALVKTNGNLTKASELLGLLRTRLSRRMEALGIRVGNTPEPPKTD
jgi:transcriptional regulator with PAS, ATPase and Fis domain